MECNNHARSVVVAVGDTLVFSVRSLAVDDHLVVEQLVERVEHGIGARRSVTEHMRNFLFRLALGMSHQKSSNAQSDFGLGVVLDGLDLERSLKNHQRTMLEMHDIAHWFPSKEARNEVVSQQGSSQRTKDDGIQTSYSPWLRKEKANERRRNSVTKCTVEKE